MPKKSGITPKDLEDALMDKFVRDFKDADDLFRTFMKNADNLPGSVRAWKTLDELVEGGETAFDQLKRNPDFLKKFDDISNDIPLNTHIFQGDLIIVNGVSGVHSKSALNIPDGYTGSFNQGDIRFKAGTKNPSNPGGNDFYTAKVEVYGIKYDAQGNSYNGWHNKRSTFFPDSWSVEKIQAEIAYGFQNKQFRHAQNNGADIFHGVMTEGTTIEFAINNGIIESSYPNLNP